jgi:hypothetical protein
MPDVPLMPPVPAPDMPPLPAPPPAAHMLFTQLFGAEQSSSSLQVVGHVICVGLLLQTLFAYGAQVAMFALVHPESSSINSLRRTHVLLAHSTRLR